MKPARDDACTRPGGIHVPSPDGKIDAGSGFGQ
jgi:hypothetical protein